MRKLNYKKLLICGISIIVFLSILITLILFLTSSNKTVETSSDNKANNIEQIIPNVTEENTSFSTSDLSIKAENANICATNRLSDYNLCYCIMFDNNTNNVVNNEDYLVFNDLILVLEENCTILFKYELNGNYSKDAYEIKISNIEIKAVSEKVDEKVLEKEKIDEKDKTQSTSPYFIKVNYKANVVTIYAKDDDGNYTVPYKAMVCSCGTYTPKSGTYKTSNKYVWRPLINNVYGHYATRIVNKILFHSVPYTSNSNDALEYWEYDKLGQTASEGCVRLTVRDAKWIYNNCPSGTMVEFYADSNPGPLGKPSAQKISSNVECRNWDPTDPKEGNPWHTYNVNKDEEENKNNKNTSSNINNIIDTTITNSIVNNSTNSESSNNTSTNNNSIQNNNIATSTNTINNTSTNNTVTTNNSTSTDNTNKNNSQTNTSTNNQTNDNIVNSTKPSTTNVIQNQL